MLCASPGIRDNHLHPYLPAAPPDPGRLPQLCPAAPSPPYHQCLRGRNPNPTPCPTGMGGGEGAEMPFPTQHPPFHPSEIWGSSLHSPHPQPPPSAPRVEGGGSPRPGHPLRPLPATPAPRDPRSSPDTPGPPPPRTGAPPPPIPPGGGGGPRGGGPR